MFKRIKSAALRGIEAISVEIEVDSSSGMPAFSLVGLPDNAVREARERVISAMRSCGFHGCSTRMTVNMSPADLRKEGAAFDLGLAIGILTATEQIKVENIEEFLFLGELSLDGKLRPVHGVLAVAANLARFSPQTILVVPYENREEATCVETLKVLAPKNLEECINGLQRPNLGLCCTCEMPKVSATQKYPDFSQVYGMETVKRALEISAAGGHNFLLVGSPGSGKTLCARCLQGILPAMLQSESLESTIIHSCAGKFNSSEGLLKSRPFRSPHHTATVAALVGGMRLRPGEASLAHNGVLFLDELPEFQRNVLESLRQPLEEGVVHINRAIGSTVFPANFVFGAAMNPCPCGYSMDKRRDCRCTTEAIKRYRGRVSGPLLDRIDLQVSVPSVPLDDSRKIKGECSSAIQKRVEAACKIQENRLSGEKQFRNGHLDGKMLKDILFWDSEAENFALKAAEKWSMSHRGYDRMLKVARTIADLRVSERVEKQDLAEAVQYRALEAEWRN